MKKIRGGANKKQRKRPPTNAGGGAMLPQSPNRSASRVAKTHKGRKFLDSRAPKVKEGRKGHVFMRGNRGSLEITKLIGDLHILAKPESVIRRERLAGCYPFEDASELERIARSKHAPFFCVGSSTKKRPAALCMGRMFEFELLDMYELLVSEYIPLDDFVVQLPELMPPLGVKPMLICQGAGFASCELLSKLRDFFCDFFSAGVAEELELKSLTHAIVLTAVPREADETANVSNPASLYKIHFRHYHVAVRKDPNAAEGRRVDVVEIGPSFAMTLGRTHLPDLERWKLARKMPRDEEKKKKNITKDVTGDVVGRVHTGKPEIAKIYTPHYHLKGSSAAKVPRDAAA